MARATLLPQTAGATLYWDGRSGVCRAVGSQTVSEHGQPSAFQVKGSPATAHGAQRSWTTEEIGLVPTCSPQAIAWDKAAALLTFSLAPVLRAATAHAVPPGATGALVWGPCPAQTASPTPAVHPVLMVQAPSASLQADRVTIVPDLPAHDPLLHHMALVLHPALEGEGGAGQLSSAALADALAVHVLRRYAASRPVLPEATGGLAPHQYVLRCRMEHAKRLLAETDLSLIDIVPQVGCAGHSHFTALFRQHVAMTPNAYRNTTRHACV